MKNTHLLFLTFFCLNVLVGCDSHSTYKIPEQNDIEVNEVAQNDSIVEYYSTQIKKYYSELKQDHNLIELEIDGERAFENDSILIISFNEIIKFGSYRYSNSSLVFKKGNNQLISLVPFPLADEKSLPLDEEINYPNRIPGEFDKSIDLTGDGIPEYVFLQRSAFKDNIEEKRRTYSIDFKKNKLKQLNLKTK